MDTALDLQSNIADMHVLLVEDNEINCEIVEFMLKEAGAEVVTANDGQAAVDTFAASEPGNFDCILMDLMMPVMERIRGDARDSCAQACRRGQCADHSTVCKHL